MILKPIDETFVCMASPASPDDVFNYVFGAFNDLLYLETDNNGSQIRPVADKFFAVNRLLAFGPIASKNKYSSVSYDCLLTIAKPSKANQEIETIDVLGQFDEITKEFLTLEFMNTFRSYFACCGHTITPPRVRPVWNINTYVPATNYTGVEITFTITL